MQLHSAGVAIGASSLPVDLALAQLAPRYPVGQERAAPAGHPTDDFARVVVLQEADAETVEHLRGALARMKDHRADDHDEWVSVLQALASLKGTEHEAEVTELAREFSQRCPEKYSDDAFDKRWASMHPTHSDFRVVFKKAQEDGWKNPGKSKRPVSTPRAVGAAFDAAVPAGGTFLAAAAGAIPSDLLNVRNALRSSEGGVRVAYDVFQDRIVIGEGSIWRKVTRADYVNLRTMLQERGFKPVARDVMEDAVHSVAATNRINTAALLVSSLAWDGQPRVDNCMVRYFGATPNPYSRALGRCLLTAIVGRILDPGCQFDMAVILVGPQGTGKTSAVRALALAPEWFGELDLAKIDDDNTSRKLRGKSVIELSELRGLAGRDAESIKAFLSRREEELRPLYGEFTEQFPRSNVFIGTSNRDDILRDPTGNRRWLPIRTGTVNVDALKADLPQMLAEAAHLFRGHGGVMWEEAESLAIAEHASFTWEDPNEVPVLHWLAQPGIAVPGASQAANGDRPFTTSEVLERALHIPANQRKAMEASVCAILSKNGWVKDSGQRRINGEKGRFWRKG